MILVRVACRDFQISKFHGINVSLATQLPSPYFFVHTQTSRLICSFPCGQETDSDKGPITSEIRCTNKWAVIRLEIRPEILEIQA